VAAAGYQGQSNSGVVVNSGASAVQNFNLAANSHQVVFSDGFESGNFSAWTSSKGLVVESAVVHSGKYAAEVNTTQGGFARTALRSTYTVGYGRVWFDIVSASSQVNVLRLSNASGVPIAFLDVTQSHLLGMTANGTKLSSSTSVSPGAFHELELGLTISGTSSTTKVWLDGSLVTALSRTINLGTAPIAQLQVGQVQSGGTYNVVFDDAAFDTMVLS
jgi:hypothetical protein